VLLLLSPEKEEDEVLTGAAAPLVELRRLAFVRECVCFAAGDGRRVHGRGEDSGSGEAGSRDTHIVAVSAMLQMETSMRRARGDGAGGGQQGEEVRSDEQHGEL